MQARARWLPGTCARAPPGMESVEPVDDSVAGEDPRA